MNDKVFGKSKRPAGFSFLFENDFQRLRLDVDVCADVVSYEVFESVNVDLVSKDAEEGDGKPWKTYHGDSSKWLESLKDICLDEWNAIYPDAGVFPLSKAHWRLSFRESTEDIQAVEALEAVEATQTVEATQGTTAVETALASANGFSLKTSKEGFNSYPENFADFLELLKELLGIPVLLLEL